MSPATVPTVATLASTAGAVPAQTAAAPTGGLTAFVGFTALVVTGFLVLARLSQGVVDDSGAAGGGDGLQVPPEAVPEGPERVTDEGSERENGEPGGPERSDPHGVPETEQAVDDTALPGDSRRDPEGNPTGAAGAVDAVNPRGGDEPSTDATDGIDHGGSTGVAGRGRDGGPTGTTAASTNREPAVASNARESISPGVLLANVALTQGLFGGILAAAAWFFQVPASALGLAGGRVAGVAAVAVGLGFGLALWAGNEVATALADAAGAGYDEGLRRMLAPASASGWAILFGGVLPVIALVEEFLFRAAAVGAAGAVLGATGPTAAGAWALALVSSLAFALGHGAQGRVGVVVTGTLGFVLAAGFVLSGSLLVVVVAHYVVNAMEFLVHEWAGLPDPVWS